MIDKVVICGIKRGNKYIPQNELMQSVGRCGRSYTKSGEAIILVKSDEYEKAQQMLYGKMPPIQSVMNEIQNVSFHVLPMILTQKVKNQQTFNLWYQKTLSYTQGKLISYQSVIDYLKQNECIAFFNENVIVWQLGQISSKFYYMPQRVKMLKDRLIDIVQSDYLQDSVAISWMLAHDNLILGTVDQSALSEYKSKVNSLGLSFTQGQLIHGYVFYCLLNGLRPKWLKFLINGEYNDFQRLINALKRISQTVKYNIDKKIDTILLSAKKRITIQMAKIMIDLNIKTKRSVLQLLQFDVTNKEQLQERMQTIQSYASKELKKQLQERQK